MFKLPLRANRCEPLQRNCPRSMSGGVSAASNDRLDVQEEEKGPT